MNGKWIKSALMLATLLISMVSLSTAAGIRTTPDTYVTQCGEVLSIDAPGVLGNDVGTGLYVEDPGSIALVKPNTGELEVHADGSFVFTASVDAPGGLITGFYYNATDGTDSAGSLAKIEFTSCKCKPPTPQCACNADAPSFDVCEGTQTPEQIEANITAAASCTGPNCDGTPVIEFPDWETDEDGLVIDGPYTYTVTCTSECTDVPPAEGTITLLAKCEVTFLPDFIAVCGKTLNELKEEVDSYVASDEISCTGDCDATPVIEYSGAVLYPESQTLQEITLTFTCTTSLPDCGETISLGLSCDVPTCTCDAHAPDIEVPCRTTLQQFEAIAKQKISRTVKNPFPVCDATRVLDSDGVVVDANRFVTGGSYTVTCQFDLPECQDTGTVTRAPCPCCKANAVPLCGCLRTTTEFPLANFLARGGGGFNTTTNKRCDETPDIDDSKVNYNKLGKYKYTVTCSGCDDVPSVAENYICIRYPVCGPTGCKCPTTHCPSCIN